MKWERKTGLTGCDEKEMLQPRRYMPGLDGLRAVAVLAVIFYHLNMPWAPGGLLGVCIFFVLSGYLITDILMAQWNQGASMDLREFWLGRARRLLPALFTMLGGVLAWILICEPHRLASLWSEVLAAVFYASNWWLIFHEVSYFASFGPPSPLGHLWSLAVEGQFYLVWPLLLGLGLRFVNRRRLLGLIAALAIASAAAMTIIYQPGLDPNRVYYGTDTRAFALLIGAVLALLWPSRKLSAALPARQRNTLDAVGGAALLAILAMMVLTDQYQSSLYYGGLLLFSVIAAVLIAVLAHPAGRLGRLMGAAPLRWLGVWSYGIYLWHYPVITMTSPAVNTGGPNIGLAIFQTALCISLAAVSWYFIEEPIRRGKRRQNLEQLPHAGKLRPALYSWWRRAPITSMICIFAALVLTVSGFTMITQAQQRAWPAETVAAGEPGGVGEPSSIGGRALIGSKAEVRLTPTGGPASSGPETELGEGSGNSPGAPSPEGAAQPSDELDQVTTGNGAAVIDDSGLVGDNYANGPETPVAPVTDGESKPTQPTAPRDQHPGFTGKGVTVIGDSVMVGVAPELKRLCPEMVVDAVIGRQVYQVPQVIKDLQARGALGNTVVIEVGSNGPFTEKQFAEILNLLGNDRRLVLINARVPKPWESAVNQDLARITAAHPNAALMDWYGASSGHDEYFRNDGVHLLEAGAKAYASLLLDTLAP